MRGGGNGQFEQKGFMVKNYLVILEKGSTPQKDASWDDRSP